MFVRTNMLLLPDRTDKSIAVLSDFRWTRSCDCWSAWLCACVCECGCVCDLFFKHIFVHCRERKGSCGKRKTLAALEIIWQLFWESVI